MSNHNQLRGLTGDPLTQSVLFNTIGVMKVRPGANLPTYGTEDSACFDLQWCPNEDEEYPKFAILDSDNRSAVFGTGLAFEIPQGYVMAVFSRSGHAFKNNVRLANCVGVIDSDYRGEVMVKLTLEAGSPRIVFEPYNKIAQAMLVKVPKWGFREVTTLSPTTRGTGGFGSTGS